MKALRKIVMDRFCFRQFEKTGNNIFIDYDIKAFTDRINDLYIEALHNNIEILKDGYAPFCKHIFIENFVDNTATYVPITEETEQLIQTAYEARTEKELPVLRRFIAKEKLNLSKAKYMDIILYSKEQIMKENEAMGNFDENKDIDYDYGIISVKFQDTDYELPMDPITMMRNALGKEEGGSGVPLDKEKYMESVKFWSQNILIK